MSRDEDIESESTEPKGGGPGPRDEGKTGGMATREAASDVADNEDTDN